MLFNIDYSPEVLRYGFIGSGLIPPASGNNPMSGSASSPSLQQSVYISHREEIYRFMPPSYQVDDLSRSTIPHVTNSHSKDDVSSTPHNHFHCQREMYDTATVKDVVKVCIGNALVQSEWERLDIIYHHQLRMYEKHIAASSATVTQDGPTSPELPLKPQIPTRQDAVCAVINAHRLSTGKGSMGSNAPSSGSIQSLCTTGAAKRSQYPEPSSAPLDIGILFLLSDVIGTSRFEKEDILAALFEVRSIPLVALVAEEQMIGKRERDDSVTVNGDVLQEHQVTIPVCVRRVQLSYSAVASLYAHGQTNGIVIEAVPTMFKGYNGVRDPPQTEAVCGASSTRLLRFTPVIGGIPVLHCCRDIVIYPEDDMNRVSCPRNGNIRVGPHVASWEWALYEAMMTFARQVQSNSFHLLPSPNSCPTTKVTTTTSSTGNIGEIPMSSINITDAVQAAKSYILSGDAFYNIFPDPSSVTTPPQTSHSEVSPLTTPVTNVICEPPIKSQVTRCISRAMEFYSSDANNLPWMGFGMYYCPSSVDSDINKEGNVISVDDRCSPAAEPSTDTSAVVEESGHDITSVPYPQRITNNPSCIVEPLPLKSFLIRIRGSYQSSYISNTDNCSSILQLASPIHHSNNKLCAAWLGGTVLVQLPAFQSHFSVDRSTYKEEGPQQCVTNFPLDWR